MIADFVTIAESRKIYLLFNFVDCVYISRK